MMYTLKDVFQYLAQGLKIDCEGEVLLLKLKNPQTEKFETISTFDTAKLTSKYNNTTHNNFPGFFVPD